MLNVDPKLVRSGYIGKIIKTKIEEKGLIISEIAEKIGTSQPSLSNALNGKKSVSDNFYKRVINSIGLSSDETKQIFFDADVEEMMYKYPDKEIFSDREMTKEEIEDFIVKNYGISKEELRIRAKNS